MSSGPSSVTPLPLSGRQGQSGSVTATQSTTNVGGGNSVNLIQSSVNVQGPYSGSISQGASSGGVLTLSLQQALNMGLRFNLGSVTQSDAVLGAQAQKQIARSTLLPNINTVVSESLERLNLRAQGVESSMFPVSVQFNYFDARVARLTQSVLDFVRIENVRSANAGVTSAREAARDARDLIVLAVGGAYLQLIATNSRITAAQAEIKTAQVALEQATDRLESGLNARIDVTRSQVQLQTDQQRLRSLQADLDTQKLRLARIVGLPRGQQFSVEETYPFTPVSGMTVDSALQSAYGQRADVQSALLQVKAAEAALKAAHNERLPNLNLIADFGAAGLRPTTNAHSVYQVSGVLTIPLYEGGRIGGDIQQADAALKQRKAELEDIKGQVDEDVRQAFINLNSAADQVGVAASNIKLSHDTLEQAQDRFVAGIADTVELVQAEQVVVQADNDYITAVFEHNLAKVSLARALGNAEQVLPRLLHK